MEAKLRRWEIKNPNYYLYKDFFNLYLFIIYDVITITFPQLLP